MAGKLASGHKYESLPEDERKRYMMLFVGSVNDMVRVNPGNYALPQQYLLFQKRIYDFKFRPDDVVIMTYSKSGTTWMQEIMWTMRNNPNLDNPAAEVPLLARCPFLESDMLFKDVAKDGAPKEMGEMMMKKFMEVCPGKNPNDGVQIQMIEAMPSKRTIKTHLPFSMLSPKLLSTCKVVFVVRNPKDTVVSFEHHHRIWKNQNYKGNRDDFVDYFVNDLLLYGSFSSMIKEAWELKGNPNLHIVHFEDLKRNTATELKKLNDFVGTKLTEEQLKNIQDYTAFAKMKARDPMKVDNSPMLNKEVVEKDGGFMRKGEAGSWKGKLTAEQNKKVEAYVEKHFAGTKIDFKY